MIRPVISTCAALAFMATSANAATLYSNDFETGSTAGLFGASVWTAPSGQKFYGGLSQGAIAALILDDVSAYSNIDLTFDLYTLLSLDGINGPDRFRVDVNGHTLLNESFANHGSWGQSHGSGGAGWVGGGTGSDPVLTGALGYHFHGPDHTYHLNFANIASGADSLTVLFFGDTDQPSGDEGFGLDNIVVTGVAHPAAVPLPAALPSLLLGLAALGLAGWRRGLRSVGVSRRNGFRPG